MVHQEAREEHEGVVKKWVSREILRGITAPYPHHRSSQRPALPCFLLFVSFVVGQPGRLQGFVFGTLDDLLLEILVHVVEVVAVTGHPYEKIFIVLRTILRGP